MRTPDCFRCSVAPASWRHHPGVSRTSAAARRHPRPACSSGPAGRTHQQFPALESCLYGAVFCDELWPDFREPDSRPRSSSLLPARASYGLTDAQAVNPVIRQRVISAVFIALLLTRGVALPLSGLRGTGSFCWQPCGMVRFLGRGALRRTAFAFATIALFPVCADRLQSGCEGYCGLRLLFWSMALLWVFRFPAGSTSLVAVAGMLALSLAWVALVRMLWTLRTVRTQSCTHFSLYGWQTAARTHRPRLGLRNGPCGFAANLAGFWAVLWPARCSHQWRHSLPHPMAGPVAGHPVAGVFSVVGPRREPLQAVCRTQGQRFADSRTRRRPGPVRQPAAAAPLLMLGIELLRRCSDDRRRSPGSTEASGKAPWMSFPASRPFPCGGPFGTAQCRVAGEAMHGVQA